MVSSCGIESTMLVNMKIHMAVLIGKSCTSYCCMLPIACCLLPVACCLLPVACFLHEFLLLIENHNKDHQNVLHWVKHGQPRAPVFNQCLQSLAWLLLTHNDTTEAVKTNPQKTKSSNHIEKSIDVQKL